MTVTSQIVGSTGQSVGFMKVEVDGVTIPFDDNSLRVVGNDPVRASALALITGLTPGSHTFTAVYKHVGSGTSTFSARTITVIRASGPRRLADRFDPVQPAAAHRRASPGATVSIGSRASCRLSVSGPNENGGPPLPGCSRRCRT